VAVVANIAAQLGQRGFVLRHPELRYIVPCAALVGELIALLSIVVCGLLRAEEAAVVGFSFGPRISSYMSKRVCA
jgi:hypothetical protein